jgi:CRISPR/Cas system CSM-associated protein Csm3 (group 7 of RAMP superfamily)
MAEFQVDLTIIVETALSIGGAGTVGTLADKSLLRDGWNRPVLPASQVKGRLRHACEAIAKGLGVPICQAPNPDTMCPHLADERIPLMNGQRHCLICQIFGSPAYRGRLRFRDLVYDPRFPENPSERGHEPEKEADERGHLYQSRESLRPGVGLDRRRGVVQEKLLFLTETTLPGTGPAFARKSAIAGDLPGPGHAMLVLMGLEQILNWGGAKSRGLGWAKVSYVASYGNGSFTLGHEQGKEVLALLCTSD